MKYKHPLCTQSRPVCYDMLLLSFDPSTVQSKLCKCNNEAYVLISVFLVWLSIFSDVCMVSLWLDGGSVHDVYCCYSSFRASQAHARTMSLYASQQVYAPRNSLAARLVHIKTVLMLPQIASRKKKTRQNSRGAGGRFLKL